MTKIKLNGWATLILMSITTQTLREIPDDLHGWVTLVVAVMALASGVLYFVKMTPTMLSIVLTGFGVVLMALAMFTTWHFWGGDRAPITLIFFLGMFIMLMLAELVSRRSPMVI